MIVVSDSSPIIHLVKINKINILQILFKEVYIPEKVYQEATKNPNYKNEADIINNCSFLKIEKVNSSDIEKIINKEEIIIHPGEEEAIALAIKLKCDLLITDDSDAKRVSFENKIKAIGTLNLINELEKKLLINNQERIEYINLLKESGLYIDKQLYEEMTNNYVKSTEETCLVDAIEEALKNDVNKNNEINNNKESVINTNKENNTNIKDNRNNNINDVDRKDDI